MHSRKFNRLYTSICLLIGLTTMPLKATEEFAKLEKINQQHLLHHWDELNSYEKKELSEQISRLDLPTFMAQQQTILNPLIDDSQVLTAFQDYEEAGSIADAELGKKMIAEGKVGCLIVAGGQGSRLGYEGPKGLYPVTIAKEKSLFQLFAERVAAAGKQVDRKLLMAIMTSSVNHAETVNYFEKERYFGLDPEQVFFFSQTDLPFLDAQGNLFLETPSKIAAGPDGNAASLKHFVEQDVWANWYAQGIRYLNYVHIDNALADPFDAELIGFHARQQADLVIKCIKRADPLEKVGVILKNHGNVQVIEYSEISDEERLARDAEGHLKHLCANISMFSFKMDFVKNIVDNVYLKFPFHKAWKAVKYLNEDGKTVTSSQPQAWKFEKFIFDLLPYAADVKALLYARAHCFAPLKNATGTDSITDVKKALQNFDKQTFRKLTQRDFTNDAIFELDPQFYYPTEALIEKWKDKELPLSLYILP